MKLADMGLDELECLAQMLLDTIKKPKWYRPGLVQSRRDVINEIKKREKVTFSDAYKKMFADAVRPPYKVTHIDLEASGMLNKNVGAGGGAGMRVFTAPSKNQKFDIASTCSDTTDALTSNRFIFADFSEEVDKLKEKIEKQNKIKELEKTIAIRKAGLMELNNAMSSVVKRKDQAAFISIAISEEKKDIQAYLHKAHEALLDLIGEYARQTDSLIRIKAELEESIKPIWDKLEVGVYTCKNLEKGDGTCVLIKTKGDSHNAFYVNPETVAGYSAEEIREFVNNGNLHSFKRIN
jgi:hypothetical protein